MRHAIMAAVVCALVVATGTLAFRVRSASGLSPWGPYEADINKDLRVNSTDMLIVAQNFNKRVVAPLPTTVPTATPYVGVRTYTVTRPLGGSLNSYTPICDADDAVTGGGVRDTNSRIVDSYPERFDANGGTQPDGSPIPPYAEGWRVRMDTYYYETVYAVCLDNPPAHVP